MEIRQEKIGDEPAIDALTSRAFAEAPHAGGNESQIVARLRADGDLALSLVALDEGEIVGHIAFSPVEIAGRSDWFGLGPVSVEPARQGTGIGARLIREGLRRLKELHAKGCVLLGDPAYYSRFGFRSDGALTFGDVPPAYLQWIAFADENPAGEVRYRPGFDA